MTPTRIRRIRTSNALTQDDLTQLLGLGSRRTVLRWEMGDVAVTGPAQIVLELIEKGELPARYFTRREAA
jgi:DNA-binding transcriptional regulator YiaG